MGTPVLHLAGVEASNIEESTGRELFAQGTQLEANVLSTGGDVQNQALADLPISRFLPPHPNLRLVSLRVRSSRPHLTPSLKHQLHLNGPLV